MYSHILIASIGLARFSIRCYDHGWTIPHFRTILFESDASVAFPIIAHIATGQRTLNTHLFTFHHNQGRHIVAFTQHSSQLILPHKQRTPKSLNTSTLVDKESLTSIMCLIFWTVACPFTWLCSDVVLPHSACGHTTRIFNTSSFRMLHCYWLNSIIQSYNRTWTEHCFLDNYYT